QRDGHPLPARTAERDVDIAFSVHYRIGDGMKIVGDLQSNRDRKWLALLCPGEHAYCPRACTFRDADYEALRAAERDSRFRFAKTDQRPDEAAGDEAAAANFHFAARNGGGWHHTFDARHSVFF